ncbi:ABC transporter [Superficieibacter electus]|uniref:ABC transporter n=1 Tax=Superficieibacter electus TaxID=2022662 RepID=A0A2P5GSD1_9ENTR|nr:sn-glycerol-3-phosphate ABC transporter ATP-binding protein UgpC [Superficieibacter electus]POP46735.1 ABC transporter [Superficieibacter electus]POP49473.1 ABC transporter [Superficieibacter electus]
MATIRLASVYKAYSAKQIVINDINLTINQGEFCVIVGPSGCGKSTLLRMIAGLEEISAGELYIDEKRMTDVPSSERGIAMVFQNYALYPHMTVEENMGFALKMARMPDEEIKVQVAAAAKSLQLEDLLTRRPAALSGGQRQRVAIGRAIVRKPGAFLFDEPLSNLDAGLRAQMRLEIGRLHREFENVATIYVTHDQVEAMTLADKIVLLNSGENVNKYGSVAQIGSPMELYEHPRNKFTASFIGSPRMNFLAAQVAEIHSDHVDVKLSDKEILSVQVDGKYLSVGENVTLGIRPEHITLTSEAGDNTLERPIHFIEQLGDATCLYLEDDLTAKLNGYHQYQRYSTVRLHIPARCCHLFDSNEQACPRLSA